MAKSFYTFQDFEKESDKRSFVVKAIEKHRLSTSVRIAKSADNYFRQMNECISNVVQWVYSGGGEKVENYTASNTKIASNFYYRLNTQRVSYSLGNGVTFDDESTKQKLGGDEFDTEIYKAAGLALRHGVSFVMLNVDKPYTFPLTEFVPLYDEFDGALKAGIRYWRLSHDRPVQAVLYEIDGYTTYRATGESISSLQLLENKRNYKQTIQTTPMFDNPEIVGEENYSELPIVPLFGTELKQSTLIGMKEAIDAYDLIKSGFANDLLDCAEIYWIVENRGGMTQKDLDEFRDKLLLTHTANANTQDGGKVTPYQHDIPYQARKELLNGLRAGLYEDFGALDVKDVSAAAKTATEINAAYQPVDEQAKDFERNVTTCIKQMLKLLNIDDTPHYTRNKVSNQKEQVEMLIMEAEYLDDETILKKLPNISSDEIKKIKERKEIEEQERIKRNPFTDDEGNPLYQAKVLDKEDTEKTEEE